MTTEKPLATLELSDYTVSPRHMKLSEILTPHHIMLDLQATDRWQAMDEMLEHLISVGDFPLAQRVEISESLKQREALISTGVGGGVAIPHAFSEHIDDVVAVFGRSRTGIDYDSHDRELVHFVILFVSPLRSYQKHLHALAAIARMFTKPETREGMMNAGSVSEIYELFRNKVVPLKA